MVNLIITVFNFTITALNCDIMVLDVMSEYPISPDCAITMPQSNTNCFYYYIIPYCDISAPL